MKEIPVKIRSWIWINAGELTIVRRIAIAVCGTDKTVYEKEDGYKYNIVGNDWWATALGEETKEDGFGKYKEINVAYRYGSECLMESWKVVLEHIFG